MSSSHYTPNGGKNESGQGWRYSDRGAQSGHGGTPPGQGGPPPRKPEFNLGEWIPIIVLFCIPSGVTQLIGFIWALRKGLTLLRQNRAYQEQLRRFSRSAVNVTRDVAETVRREVANARSAEKPSDSGAGKASGGTAGKRAGSAADSAPRSYSVSHGGAPLRAGKSPTGGMGLVIGGAILAGIFAIATLTTGLEFFRSLLYNSLSADDLIKAFVSALFTGGGFAMLFSGIGMNRRKERAMNYLAYIGTNQQVDLAHMAASFDVPVRKLCKDLRWMLSKNILPTGYLDLAAGKLFLTNEGYRAPAPEKSEEVTAEELRQEESDILSQIRQVNDDIPDEVMSAKIDRIEEITGKILAYQSTHPDSSGQLRSFLNYYLPTTLKILRAYAQLDAQGIEGENISAAKARIEGMMDQVVSGFEKQLDKLFQNEAMDVNTDVQVLENMLKKDGLSDDPGMTMTL